MPAVGAAAARTRGALRFFPSEAVALILVPAGAAFGPHGLGLLSEPVLSAMDPAMAAALAAVGVIVAFNLTPAIFRWNTAPAALIDVVLTTLLVSAGLMAVRGFAPGAADSPVVLALMSACAWASVGSVYSGRVAAIEQMLAVIATALLLAWTGEGRFTGAAWLVVRGAALIAMIAMAGWLLVSQTGSDGEQRVFTIGTLLLLGGASAYVSVSPLLAGLIAGLCWNAADAEAGRRIGRDVEYLRHPLVALLLLVAGARLQPAAPLLTIGIVFALGRVAGSLAAGRMADLGGPPPADVGLRLPLPGLTGIAVALAVLPLWTGDGGALLFTVVVVGSLGTEVASWLISGPDRP